MFVRPDNNPPRDCSVSGKVAHWLNYNDGRGNRTFRKMRALILRMSRRSEISGFPRNTESLFVTTLRPPGAKLLDGFHLSLQSLDPDP